MSRRDYFAEVGLEMARRPSSAETASRWTPVMPRPQWTWSSACRELEAAPDWTGVRAWGGRSAAPVDQLCGRIPRTRRPCLVAVCARSGTRDRAPCDSATPTNSAVWTPCYTRHTDTDELLRTNAQAHSHSTSWRH